jgi:hypothetical protein
VERRFFEKIEEIAAAGPGRIIDIFRVPYDDGGEKAREGGSR